MIAVGIIANPASGQDIRRLIAHATVFPNHEKVNIVRRILLGLDSVGVEKVYMMPDYYGIGREALEGISSKSKLKLRVSEIDMKLTASPEDSFSAASILNKLKVKCIITLGGDGTNRVVAKGCGKIPLLPVSTGTNNVFPYMIEGTIVGMVAGIFAESIVDSRDCVIQTKKLDIIKNGECVDIALIDAAVIDAWEKGTGAIWDPDVIKTVITTRAEPNQIGLSSIAGNISMIKVTDKKGLMVAVGGTDCYVKAPISAGLVKEIAVKDFKFLNIGEKVYVSHKPSIIALDGEREIEVEKNDEVEIELNENGPLLINIDKVLENAVAQNYFIRNKG